MYLMTSVKEIRNNSNKISCIVSIHITPLSVPDRNVEYMDTLARF